MAHHHRLVLAICLLLGLPVVTGWVAVAAASQFVEPTTTGLIVSLVVPPGDQALMPGGSYREVFAISTQVDAAYAFRLTLLASGKDVDGLASVMQDSTGRTVYSGAASHASFVGSVTSRTTELITVTISLSLESDDIQPGAPIDQTWTVNAQPL